MTQAVVTRRDGDVFQARIFWLKAAHLLDEEGSIVRVGFESGPKGFDDVWVEYDPDRAPQDQFGNSLNVERMQCKWHATPGTFSHEDLARPEYINATTTSLLERALDAFRTDQADRRTSRLSLVTNHCAAKDDPLCDLIRMKSFTLDLDKLFEGKTVRSATGKLRKLWCQHLRIDDDELRALCAALSFNQAHDSLEMLRARLDDACRVNGLIRPNANASSTIYDSNIFEWVGQRRMIFDRRTFKAKCSQEGLLAKRPTTAAIYGVKSFEHAFDRLEDRCARVLNMVAKFDDRSIRDDSAWHTTLLPELRRFLTALPAEDGRLRLAIEAHATLAFAAGTIMDTKSGRLVELEQRSPTLKVWAPDDQGISSELPGWEFGEYDVNADGDGTAWAIGITRDTEVAVRRYIRDSPSKFRRLLIAKPHGGPSPSAVASGAHANALAEALAAKIKLDRETNGTTALERCHLFIAGPNAFTFYLGRHVQAIKPLTLYEFDFGQQLDGSYRPSLSYPDIAAT